MVATIHNLTGAGNYAFHDAVAYPTVLMDGNFHLADLWHFQNYPFFDGVDTHDVEEYDKYNLLNEITYGIQAVDASSNSRIDKAFGKSFMLRYVMGLIADVHNPMHTTNGFSSAHKDGDNWGHDYKLKGDYGTLFDLWDNSLGMFGKMSYPLQDDTKVKEYAADITAEWNRDSLKTELKEDSKKAWAVAAHDIAEASVYSVTEGSTPSTEYLEKGRNLMRKLVALAAYRIVDQVIYMMGKQ